MSSIKDDALDRPCAGDGETADPIRSLDERGGIIRRASCDPDATRGSVHPGEAPTVRAGPDSDQSSTEKNELVWTEMEGACSICQLMNEVIPGEPITAEDTGYQHARGVGCSRGYGLIMALRACPKAIHACFRTAGADI